MKKKIIKICNISLVVISMVSIVLLLSNVFKLDVLPTKYLILVLLGLGVVYLLTVAFIFIKKKSLRILNIIGYILMVIILVITCMGLHYTNITLKFIKNKFNISTVTYTNSYMLLSKNDYSELNDFINKDIAYYGSIPHVDKALDKLSSTIEYNKVEIENITDVFKNKNILIEKSLYETLKENKADIDYGDFKVVYEFEITIDEVVDTNELKDAVNIYIGGYDFTHTNNDFNMIVTINRKTRKVLLTSIPRDYYFYFDALNTKELLDYTLIWGVNVPVSGLEKLFNTHIDYYMTIDTDSIVELVDELGGVEFCSDYAFTTTHAKTLDSYNDNVGRKLYVEKGCKEYNGIEILTIARERLKFNGGDRQRQKNCQQILINIFNKLASVDNVSKYTKLLDKLSSLYTTNIPDKLVTSVAKDRIDGNNWTVDTQSADGKSGSGWMHLHTYYGPTMIPYDDSVASVSEKIKEYYE